MITVPATRNVIHFEWRDAYRHTLFVTIRERAVRISFALPCGATSWKYGELIRWRMVAVICCVLIVPLSCVRRKISSAREISLYHVDLETPIFNGCEALFILFARVCVCVCYVEKATHCKRPALSLFLSFSRWVSPRLTHVHASLFSPCANCCILHACMRSKLSLSHSFSFSLLSSPAYFFRLSSLTFLTFRLLQHFSCPVCTAH